MHCLYYILCLLLLSSCAGSQAKQKQPEEAAGAAQGKERVKYVNSLKMTVPARNSICRFGEVLEVAFESKDRFPVDSSVVYVDGREVARLGKGVTAFSWRVDTVKVGRRTVKVQAHHPGNSLGTASATIEVLPDKAPAKCSYKVLKIFPHDPKAYTQGLIYHKGYMYEGTGQYGESSIRKIDMKSGDILSVLNIDSQLFGEGITIFGNKIYQITWRSRKGFVYDLETFSPESTFTYNSEGWGITTMGDRLVMSDGSNKLYHIDPSTFNILKEVEVCDNAGKVSELNELEYVDGLVWANIWMSERIVAIDPETGVVKYELHMGGLLSPAEKAQLDDKDDVLNGIAWNPESRTFYLTGKRWRKLFEVKITAGGLQ